jgi:hypothetical protein
MVLGVGVGFLGLLLSACGGQVREKERYFDPQGYFSAHLPSANQIQVVEPQSGDGGPALLTGVVSAPQPPTSAAGNIGIGVSPVQGDTTVYFVYVFDATAFSSLDDFSLVHLSDPSADLQVKERVSVGGKDGLLVVADHEGEQGEFSVASGFLLEQGRGYWIVAAFPKGAWGDEQTDFLEVLRSFRTEAPPALAAIPADTPSEDAA